MPRVSFPTITRPPRAQIWLTSAREHLQAIAIALSWQCALNIAFMVDTVADYMPSEEDF